MDLVKEILDLEPKEGTVNIYWLGGTSYIIRSRKLTVGLDIYLTNACMGKDGSYKRLVPSPVKAEDLKLDYIIATHDHGDHFDKGSLSTLIESKDSTKLIGPASVKDAAKKLKINEKNIIELNRGQEIDLDNINIKAVFADHGADAPDCIGVIMAIDGKRIYFTSDTCYRPDLPELVDLGGKIDLLIVPINGREGNPDPKDASYITSWVKPDKVIPSHFWMFAEHCGDPGAFAEYCRAIAPGTEIIIPAIGERINI